MNTPLKIAICEDCSEDTQRLIDCILRSGIPAAWDQFESGEALLAAFHPGKYDLMLLDIYMNGMEGVELAGIIRSQDESVVLAFTTSSEEHTLESYRLGALKYLVKPVEARAVGESMLLADMARRHRHNLSLMSGGRWIELPLDTILYLEAQNHTVLVHTFSGILRASQSERLAEIELRLPCPPFLRCHYSYIVNLRYVQSADQDFVMRNGDRVYIRQKELKKHTNAYKSWLLDELDREV
ncbi:MAG: LytTR family DNA-binding domain-containing protein [Clostridium sp.]|nr:LytTR family DNA-binding domain-containing protein [Clostridium sp.]